MISLCMDLLMIATEIGDLWHFTCYLNVHLFCGSEWRDYFEPNWYYHCLYFHFNLESGNPKILQNYLTHYLEFKELIFGPYYSCCFYSRYSIKHSNIIDSFKGFNFYSLMDSIIISFAHFHLSLVTRITKPNYWKYLSWFHHCFNHMWPLFL